MPSSSSSFGPPPDFNISLLLASASFNKVLLFLLPLGLPLPGFLSFLGLGFPSSSNDTSLFFLGALNSSPSLAGLSPAATLFLEPGGRPRFLPEGLALGFDDLDFLVGGPPSPSSSSPS